MRLILITLPAAIALPLCAAWALQAAPDVADGEPWWISLLAQYGVANTLLVLGAVWIVRTDYPELRRAVVAGFEKIEGTQREIFTELRGVRGDLATLIGAQEGRHAA
jgi:hypothetical protein